MLSDGAIALLTCVLMFACGQSTPLQPIDAGYRESQNQPIDAPSSGVDEEPPGDIIDAGSSDRIWEIPVCSSHELCSVGSCRCPQGTVCCNFDDPAPICINPCSCGNMEGCTPTLDAASPIDAMGG
jgi:hypothetical protein